MRNIMDAASMTSERLFQASPGPVPTPRVISIASFGTTGGSIGASTTYWFKASAVSASGEGLTSPGYSYYLGSTGTNTNQLGVSILVYPGTISAKVYRGTATGTELLVGSVTGITFTATELMTGFKIITFTDTGTTPSGALPTVDASGPIGETVVYGPVPANTSVRLDELVISNRGAASGTCGVSVIPAAGSLDGTQYLVPSNFVVQPGDSRIISLRAGIDTGEKIAVASSTSLITVTGSGLVTK